MPTNFAGKWTSCKSENWDKFLGKFGVPLEKLPADIKVTEEITQSGNKITIKTTNNKDDKVKEVTINVGSNFKDTLMSGVELEFTTAWQGDKLVLTGTDGKGSAVREMDGAHMKVSLTHEGTTATTTYDKA
ncbi:fatty acid-binding protein 10-A, liver basic-like [Patiria miniata]|uniref:Uncharacterized protein n=1 Tax=Patiria miniata TaxID=46514 RepID=A0A914BIA8_PATMI|nr:fatty acid-binding protein 10-A, liver basic-like [Patiria miniata]